jgi:DNA-binding transcriptional MerR regulator
LEAEGVQALAAWRSLRRNQNLSIENIREMLFLSNEEQEKWIEDYVERGTAVARKQVQHVETAIMQALDDMSIAQVAGATS